MKHKLLNLIAASGLLCATGITLQAASYRMEGNIPFAFHVGKADFPAGHYVLTGNSLGTYQTMKNTDTSRSSFVAGGAPAVTGNSQPRLVFNKYGSQYFLSEVWTDKGTGTHLSPSSVEKEVRDSARRASLNVPLVASR